MSDLDRYHRQMLLPGFGVVGQQRLARATVAIVGCGALGTVSAAVLARAGVGRLILIDRDTVEWTNLQRQMLFTEADARAGRPKAEVVRERLAEVNSGIHLETHIADLHAGNAQTLLAGADVLVDGLDNFETRYLLNDLAVRDGRPYLYGGAVQGTGAAMVVLPPAPPGAAPLPWETPEGGGATACLRCLFEEMPAPGTGPTCDTAGVLGPAVGLVANWQAAETLKLLTGQWGQVSRSLLQMDLFGFGLRQLALEKARDADCPCCVRRTFGFLETSGGEVVTLCGRGAVQVRPVQTASLDLATLAERLAAHGPVEVNRFLLRFTRTEADRSVTLTLFPDGRALIQGVADPAMARSLYARYVGM